MTTTTQNLPFVVAEDAPAPSLPTVVPRTSIVIEGLARLKIAMCHEHANFGTEIGGLLIPSTTDPLVYTDLIVPRQRGTTARVVFDTAHLSLLLAPYYRLFPNGYIPFGFWHYHHTMEPTPSSDDFDTFNRSFGERPFCTMVITSNTRTSCLLRATALSSTITTSLDTEWRHSSTLPPPIPPTVPVLDFLSSFKDHLNKVFNPPDLLPTPTYTPDSWDNFYAHHNTRHNFPPVTNQMSIKRAVQIAREKSIRRCTIAPFVLPDDPLRRFTSPLSEFELRNLLPYCCYLAYSFNLSFKEHDAIPDWLVLLLTQLDKLNDHDSELIEACFQVLEINPDFIYEWLDFIPGLQPETPLPSTTTSIPSTPKAQNLLVTPTTSTDSEQPKP